MAKPIVPHLPEHEAKSRWSLPVLVLGAIAALVLSAGFHLGWAAFATVFAAVLAAKLLDELADKRSR